MAINLATVVNVGDNISGYIDIDESHLLTLFSPSMMLMTISLSFPATFLNLMLDH